MNSVLALEDFQGLVFYPPHQIATLTPFLHGWWRAVTLEGGVLHLPQRPDGPWVPLGPSWVLPSALQNSPDGWLDQAGFLYQGQLEIQPAPAQPTDPLYALRTSGGVTWLTDQGQIPTDLTLQQALKLHPELLQITQNLYGNPLRFRSLRPAGEKFELRLDNGNLLHSLSADTARKFARRLGLPGPSRLEPILPGLREYKLRDWPQELYTAEAEQLKAWFDDANVEIANCLLQGMRYRQQGIPIEYGDDHRGYWYKPVSTVLYRTGFIDPDQMRWAEDKNAACLRYRRLIERAVGELKWFTYRELGFSDPGGRQIGKTQPHILFLVEKKCLEGYARKLADYFGFTYLISGGTTKFVDTEFLVHDLQLLGIQEVDLFSFADFDPEGTALTDGFIPQLERFGMRVQGPPKMVVHPSCFTERELRLFSLPCPMSSPAAITMTQRWLERTGGIYGQAFGIGSDHLQPIERVIKRLEELGCSR